MSLEVGQAAPDFTLKDQDGRERTLSEYKGEWVLVYFYPRDNTPGCTKEACTLRDEYEDFRRLTITIFGISGDSVESHAKFAKKHDLPFPLLADTEKEVMKAYGSFGKKKFMGREYEGIFRNSYLIDPEGKLRKIYEKVKPAEHAKEVIKDVQTMSA